MCHNGVTQHCVTYHCLIISWDMKMELSKPVESSGESRMGALVSMFYEPTRAFTMLEPRRYTLFVTVLLVASSCCLLLYYFSVVDFSWMAEQMFASIKDAERREQSMKMVTRSMMMMGALGGAVIGTPLVLALMALYFSLVGKVINRDMRFGAGFALSAWASVPNLLVLPLGAMQILLASHGQISLSQLNPLSLNQLVFQYGMAHPMASLMDSLSVTSVWTAVLLVIGFKTWTRSVTSTAVAVVAAPYVVIYGIWFAYALSKAA